MIDPELLRTARVLAAVIEARLAAIEERLDEIDGGSAENTRAHNQRMAELLRQTENILK